MRTILLLFISSLSIQPILGQEKLKFRIEGTVFEICDTSVLEGINVELYKFNDSTSFSTTTDSMGYFKFDDELVDNGDEYSLTLSGKCHLGSKLKYAKIDTTESTAYIHDFILQPNGCKHCPDPPLRFTYDTDQIELQDDSLNYWIQILEENPTIVVEIVATRSEDEKDLIAFERADYVYENFCKYGIVEERIIEPKREHFNSDTSLNKKRYVQLNVIAWDYIPREEK